MQEMKREEAEATRKGKQALEHEDLVEEPDEEYLERFSRKIQRWYIFKKNGGRLAKGMTTWDVLDNFSEDESGRAPRAEGSSSEDGSDSEDSGSDEKSEPESKESIQRIINQVYSSLSKAKLIKHLNKTLLKLSNSQQKHKKLKADYENLSKQANHSEDLVQNDFIKTKDLENDYAVCYKPFEHSLALKEYCNTNADQNKIISMLCNFRTNNTNGIEYSNNKTLEESSLSVI